MNLNDFRKILTVYLLLWFFVNSALSQADRPQIVEPSPVSAALFKYQGYPVDHSTGLPQIDIPLYEVKSGSLTLPISVSYHASGRKVYDRDGNIGLGWTLNAGGMIVRTIYGSPDFGTTMGGVQPFPNPFKLSEDLISSQHDYEYFQRISKYSGSGEINPGDWLDSEYDIFSYSINGLSGKFLFKDSAGVITPVLISDKAYKIIPTITSSGLSEITMIDDKGITYEFVASESKASTPYVPTTGWAVSKIISADKTDTILFSYAGIGSVPHQTRSHIITLTTSFDMNYETPPSQDREDGYHDHTAYYNVSRISEIKFKSGKLVFNGQANSLLISDMQVLNDKNQVVKSIEFNKPNYDSFIGHVAVYRLSDLIFKDLAGSEIERYSFEYYPLVGAGKAMSRDYWGYYNGSEGNYLVPYIPQFIYPQGMTGGGGSTTISHPSANRNPSLETMKSGVLKKITYPTGGSSEFIYELNKCSLPWDNTVKDGPGLRIYQIKTQENNSLPIIKTYRYGVNESGVGVIDLLPQTSNMAEVNKYTFLGVYPSGPGPYDPNRSGTYTQVTFYSDFLPEVEDIASRPVIYPEVTEYLGTLENNVGKIVYNYSYSSWSLSGMVTDYPGIPKRHIYNWNYFNIPSLVSQVEYKVVKTNNIRSYKKSREIFNNYTTNVLENVTGLHVRRVNVYPQTGRNVVHNYSAEKYASVIAGDVIYAYRNYQIVTGTKLLTSTIEKNYFDNQAIITTSNLFEYNSRRLLSKQTTQRSDGKTLQTVIKYPFDYSGNAILTDMVNANHLNYPVEKIESLVEGSNTTHLKSTKTNYDNWGTTVARYAPESIEVKNEDAPYETRLRYHSYDNDGNPLSLSKENDSKISYIWDHNKELPVAEAVNASETEIAYTSFEGDGGGNWSGVSSANIVNSQGITGEKYYNLNTAGLTLAGLSSSKKYRVTYWSRNGVYSVNGTAQAGYPKSIRSVSRGGNTWTCWEHLVSNTTSITVSGSGGIDELRLAPQGASITSYTYIPLVGQSSINDPNNRISYFLYHNSGRLSVVQDMDGHYLKTFEYQTLSSQP